MLFLECLDNNFALRLREKHYLLLLSVTILIKVVNLCIFNKRMLVHKNADLFKNFFSLKFQKISEVGCHLFSPLHLPSSVETHTHENSICTLPGTLHRGV